MADLVIGKIDVKENRIYEDIDEIPEIMFFPKNKKA